MTPPLFDLNPAHIRTLQEVVRRGSFSRAAEDLHLSQPAVSLHIRQLEEKVGLALVERVGKRTSPTRAGEILLEHAERAFAELEGARQALQDLRGVVGGRVRVGTGATASIHLLPPCSGGCARVIPPSSSWSSRATRGRWPRRSPPTSSTSPS